MYKSTKLIDWLRSEYPGRWVYVGGGNQRYVWTGEHFSVIREKGQLTRTDTGEVLTLPKAKERSHFIHRILEEKLGGKWERHPCIDGQGSKESGRAEWVCPWHDFKVYTSSESEGKVNRRVYRRSDTREVVYRSERRD